MERTLGAEWSLDVVMLNIKDASRVVSKKETEMKDRLQTTGQTVLLALIKPVWVLLTQTGFISYYFRETEETFSVDQPRGEPAVDLQKVQRLIGHIIEKTLKSQINTCPLKVFLSITSAPPQRSPPPLPPFPPPTSGLFLLYSPSLPMKAKGRIYGVDVSRRRLIKGEVCPLGS